MESLVPALHFRCLPGSAAASQLQRVESAVTIDVRAESVQAKLCRIDWQTYMSYNALSERSEVRSLNQQLRPQCVGVG